MATFEHSRCAPGEKGLGSNPCVNKQDCKYFNVLTTDQQLSTHLHIRREKKSDEKSAAASLSLVDAGSDLILGQVNSKVSGKYQKLCQTR